MDIAGVNLQEESILPATMTEGVSRTCKDEHLLELRALRWKVASIGELIHACTCACMCMHVCAVTVWVAKRWLY